MSKPSMVDLLTQNARFKRRFLITLTNGTVIEGIPSLGANMTSQVRVETSNGEWAHYSVLDLASLAPV